MPLSALLWVAGTLLTLVAGLGSALHASSIAEVRESKRRSAENTKALYELSLKVEGLRGEIALLRARLDADHP